MLFFYFTGSCLNKNPKKIPYSGTAGALNEYGSGHIASNAFKPQSETKYPYSSFGTTTFKLVWYKFTSRQVVSKLSFTSRKDSENLYQTPKAFYIVASDDCKSWTNLLYVRDAGFTRVAETRSFTIPCANQGTYYCYGLKVMSCHDGSKDGGTGTWWASLSNTIMYS